MTGAGLQPFGGGGGGDVVVVVRCPVASFLQNLTAAGTRAASGKLPSTVDTVRLHHLLTPPPGVILLA